MHRGSFREGRPFTRDGQNTLPPAMDVFAPSHYGVAARAVPPKAGPGKTSWRNIIVIPTMSYDEGKTADAAPVILPAASLHSPVSAILQRFQRKIKGCADCGFNSVAFGVTSWETGRAQPRPCEIARNTWPWSIASLHARDPDSDVQRPRHLLPPCSGRLPAGVSLRSSRSQPQASLSLGTLLSSQYP